MAGQPAASLIPAFTPLPPSPVTPPPKSPDQSAATAPSEPTPPSFPHIRVDREHRTVEIDGSIVLSLADEGIPGGLRTVELEVLVCTPDSKEHESLIVTKARPAHVHAALLLVGLNPGQPGSVEWDGKQPVIIAPTGDRVIVEFQYASKETGATWLIDPCTWITRRDGTSLCDPAAPNTGPRGARMTQFLFTGSRFRSMPKADAPGERADVYMADGAGTLIGLSTFGTETIAMADVHSPDSQVQPAAFFAAKSLPEFGTPVIVRIRAEPLAR